MTVLPLNKRLSLFFRPKHNRRLTVFALVVLMTLSLYFLFVQHNSFPEETKHKLGGNAWKLQRPPAERKPYHSGQRKQIHMDTAQELAAVSSFLASLPHNVIPSSVDPLEPIDPQLVLDFDTSGPRAEQEVRAMVEDVWTRNPVFLYSQLYSSISRDIKSLLANMNLRPAPTIIDVDVRDDANVLRPLLSRLAGIQELPLLIIGGKVVGNVEHIRALEQSGELRDLITLSGAVIDGAKRKKHKQG
ncbi:hypothetical protein M378DRAFT_76056 [Amanita muscaria Koide BX008]|uniref:Uncharacterized protein n=1 Tax=Amanita muscaria (strain Koide BX008) TaxID=946122 RepID=A0A0C2XAM0_AMAMK|nr:hypothetical protein M378DRAFT_76056 [Amanita muscaria Koide BX008]